MKHIRIKKDGAVLRRFAFVMGAIVLLGIATASLWAYRFFTERPGEDALRFIPRSAVLVVTADLSPSASQAMVFKQIDDALARNHLDNQVQGLYSNMAKDMNLPEELGGCLSRNGAFAMLSSNALRSRTDENTDLLFFVGLSDSARAESLLDKSAQKLTLGSMKGYTNDRDAYILIIDNLLVLSPSKKALQAVVEVAQKRIDNIVSVPEFTKTRQDLDSDSNVMVFVNVKEITKGEIKEEQAKQMVEAFGWVGVGFAVRDGGLTLKSSVNYDPEQVPQLKRLADVKPLRTDLYNSLPSGAYMLMAGSNTAASLELVKDVFGEFDKQNNLRTIDRDIRKEIGMGVSDGIIPAFRGNTVIALYPSRGNATGADLLVMMDDFNGADPAKLADAVRRSLSNRYSTETKKGPLMMALKVDGSRWQMTPSAEDEMKKSFTFDEKDAFNAQPLIDGKTVTYARVGNGVFVSTSKSLLDRALNAYQTHTDTLVGDSSIIASANEAVPGAQGVMIIDLARIATCVEAMLRYDQMDADAAKMTKSIMDMVKGFKVPVHGSSAFVPGHASATFMMPMDYDRLIDFIGTLGTEQNKSIGPQNESK